MALPPRHAPQFWMGGTDNFQGGHDDTLPNTETKIKIFVSFEKRWRDYYFPNPTKSNKKGRFWCMGISRWQRRGRKGSKKDKKKNEGEWSWLVFLIYHCFLGFLIPPPPPPLFPILLRRCDFILFYFLVRGGGSSVGVEIHTGNRRVSLKKAILMFLSQISGFFFFFFLISFATIVFLKWPLPVS